MAFTSVERTTSCSCSGCQRFSDVAPIFFGQKESSRNIQKRLLSFDMRELITIKHHKASIKIKRNTHQQASTNINKHQQTSANINKHDQNHDQYQNHQETAGTSTPRWPRRGHPLFAGAERCVRSSWEDQTIGFFCALFAKKRNPHPFVLLG